jgi:hypothetical protein
MDLSIVIAATDARRTIEACLDRLEQSCARAGVQAEFIVADASTDGTAECIERRPTARLFRFMPGTLAPQLWGEGYRRARGTYVAFTTGHCLAVDQWAASLCAALKSGAAGAGGPLVAAPEANGLDRAVYFLRYSAFTSDTIGAGRISGEIAGDNAMYARVWLDQHPAILSEGFWEVDFHRAVRARGGWLAAVPEAVMQFGPSFPAATILAHRFAHGRHFGAGRVRGGRRTAWQIVAAAPLVPVVLLGRVIRRIRRRDAAHLASALPWFLVIAAAWAAGEAWGAVRGAGLPAAAPLQTDDVRCA